MLALPNTTTTDLYTDAGAAVFPSTDSGAGTPYASGFLFIANQPAFVSIRKGPTSGSSGAWTPDTLVQPTMVPLTVGQPSAAKPNPDYIFGVRARSAVAGSPAQVFGALFQPGEISFVPGAQFTGTVSQSGGFTPVSGGLSGITGSVSAAGAILAGTGFTVAHGGTGLYTISFTTPFAAAPVGFVDHLGNPATTAANMDQFMTGSCRVSTVNIGGAALDVAFVFCVFAVI